MESRVGGIRRHSAPLAVALQRAKGVGSDRRRRISDGFETVAERRDTVKSTTGSCVGRHEVLSEAYRAKTRRERVRCPPWLTSGLRLITSRDKGDSHETKTEARPLERIREHSAALGSRGKAQADQQEYQGLVGEWLNPREF